MTLEMIRTLYRYNAWADAQVLAAAEAVTPAQFLAGGGASFDSLRDTLAHTLGAEWLYLERWQGRSPAALPPATDFPDVAALRRRWQQVEHDAGAFLTSLTEARLAETLAYVNFKGERWAYPLWQQMVHAVNHGTQHRSEAAVMLTHFGHSPGPLDFLHFVDLETARG
jgi:uncharacterized damage-inducible protein DinB